MGDRLGIPSVLGFFFFIAGINLITVSMIPPTCISDKNVYAFIFITLTSLSTLSISAAYVSIFILSTELYPTYARNFALLFLLSLCNFGGILTPQILLLGHLIWKPLSYIIFGNFSLLSCVFLVILSITQFDKPYLTSNKIAI